MGETKALQLAQQLLPLHLAGCSQSCSGRIMDAPSQPRAHAALAGAVRKQPVSSRPISDACLSVQRHMWGSCRLHQRGGVGHGQMGRLALWRAKCT